MRVEDSSALLSRRHHDAVINAEARRVALTLASYGGVLTEGALVELCGASRWTAGGFSTALARALELGLIRDLGLGFYASQPRGGGHPA